MVGMPCIAVIDNDLDFHQFIRDLLSDTSWETVAYPEVSGTFNRLKALEPDLILLDLGASATTASWGILLLLQRDPATQNIPLLVCAGGQSHLSPQERELLGPRVTVVPKPFDIDALLRAIESATTT